MSVIKAFDFVELPSGLHVVSLQKEWLTEGLMRGSEVDSAIVRLKTELDELARSMKEKLPLKFPEIL